MDCNAANFEPAATNPIPDCIPAAIVPAPTPAVVNPAAEMAAPDATLTTATVPATVIPAMTDSNNGILFFFGKLFFIKVFWSKSDLYMVVKRVMYYVKKEVLNIRKK